MRDIKGTAYEPFSLYISEDMKEKMKYIAGKHKRSTTKEIEYLLEQYIADYEQQHGEIPTTWHEE